MYASLPKNGRPGQGSRQLSTAMIIVSALLLGAILTIVLMNKEGLPIATPHDSLTASVPLQRLEQLEDEGLRITTQENNLLNVHGQVLKQIMDELQTDTGASDKLVKAFEALSAKLAGLEEKVKESATVAKEKPKNSEKAKSDIIHRSVVQDSSFPHNYDPESVNWLELGKLAPECQDKLPSECPGLVESGECKSNKLYMSQNCRQSCSIPCVPEYAWRQQVTVEQISWQPRAYHLHRILHPAECEYLIELATPLLERSHVIGEGVGQDFVDPIRDSWGMFMLGDLASDPVVITVNERVGHFSMVPPQFAEDMQVLRYEIGQHYFAHTDYFSPLPDMGRGDHPGAPGQQRVGTMLMFLRSVELGGETHFPYAVPMPGSKPQNATCGTLPKKGISVQPVQGNSVLFYSRRLTGDMDYRSTHAGCPVVKGQKWSATKWLRDGSMELTWKLTGDVFGDPKKSQLLDASH